MKTLVDCGCIARVHAEGSGIEIDYCPVHLQADDMKAAIHAAHGLLVPLQGQVTPSVLAIREAVNILRGYAY